MMEGLLILLAMVAGGAAANIYYDNFIGNKVIDNFWESAGKFMMLVAVMVGTWWIVVKIFVALGLY